MEEDSAPEETRQHKKILKIGRKRDRTRKSTKRYVHIFCGYIFFILNLSNSNGRTEIFFLKKKNIHTARGQKKKKVSEEEGEIFFVCRNFDFEE